MRKKCLTPPPISLLADAWSSTGENPKVPLYSKALKITVLQIQDDSLFLKGAICRSHSLLWQHIQRENYCSRWCGACYCGGVQCFLSHCLSCSLFWHRLANVMFSIAYHLPRLFCPCLVTIPASLAFPSHSLPSWLHAKLVGAPPFDCIEAIHTQANMNTTRTYALKCIH